MLATHGLRGPDLVQKLALDLRHTPSPEVANDLARLLLPQLTRLVATNLPGVDPAVASDAATDAILKFLQDSSLFRPERSHIRSFLTMIATRLAIDRLRRARTEARHLVAFRRTFCCCRASDAVLDDIRGGSDHEPLTVLDHVVTTDEERRYVEAKLRGDQHLQGLAEAVGCGDLSPLQQRQALKKISERLRIRGHRLANRRRTDPMVLCR